MKIVRIRLEGDEIAYGGVEPEGIRVYRGTPFVAWEPTEAVVSFAEVQLLAPVFPTTYPTHRGNPQAGNPL